MKDVQDISFSPYFYSDIFIESVYYTSLVRSPIAYGKIRSIFEPELPPGYYFFTAKDIPGKKYISVLDTHIPIFASDKVRYIGEAIGIVCGIDPVLVTELANRIEIYFDPLEESEHIVCEYSFSFPAKADDSEKQEPHSEAITVENTYEVQSRYYNLYETNGAVVSYTQQAHEPEMTVFSPTKWPNHVLSSIQDMLCLSSECISIRQTKTSDTFSGNVWFPSLVACQASLASFLLKRPTRLVLLRYEDAHFTEQEIGVSITYKTLVEKTGIIRHSDISIRIDGGSYSPFIKELTDRILIASLGVYNLQSFHLQSKTTVTHTIPKGLGSDWGESHGFYAIEMHIQEIASRLALFPLEVKMQNIAEDKKESIIPIVEAILKISDYKRKYSAYQFLSQNRKNVLDGPLKGMGFACAYQGSTFLGSSSFSTAHTVEMSMNIDGSVTVKTSAVSSSLKQIWKKIIAEELSIEGNIINFEITYTTRNISVSPQLFSGNISVLTQLIKKCCTQIQKQRFRNPLPIEVKQHYTPKRKKIQASDNFSNLPYMSLSWGAAVIEVEINPNTYAISILNIWLLIDGGVIILKKEALHTIKKSLSRSFLQMAPDITVCEQNIQFLPSTKESKGVGDLPFSLIPGAYANAISQALYKTVTHMPVDTQFVYQTLKERFKV